MTTALRTESRNPLLDQITRLVCKKRGAAIRLDHPIVMARSSARRLRRVRLPVKRMCEFGKDIVVGQR